MISDNFGQMFQNIQASAQERKGAAYSPKATKVVLDNCGCEHEQVTRKPVMRSAN